MKRIGAALAGKGFAAVAALFSERRCAACLSVFRPPALTQAGWETAGHKAAPAGAARLFCRPCLDAMPRRMRGICPRCGEPSAWPDLPPALCGDCLASPPPWQEYLCHGLHEGLLRSLLIRLKFQEEVNLAHALGMLLAEHPALRRLDPQVVVPIPLYDDRLVARGFNQALELARPLAATLRIPLAPALLTRNRATPPQVGADRETRLQGMRGVFDGNDAARDKRVLLVDDTLTTGATLAEAARALLSHGAMGVDVAVISRTAKKAPPVGDGRGHD